MCKVSAGPGSVQCKLCPKAFDSSGGLAVHVRRMHTESSAARPVKGERVLCEEPSCDKTFSQASEARRHFKSAHLKETAHKCTTCGLEFTRQWLLKQHFNMVHLKLRPFWCEVKGCEKTFSQKSHLTTHTKTVHLKMRAYECSSPGCSHSATTANSLKSHVAGVHLKAKPFLCPYIGCTYAAVSKTHLVMHKKSPKHKTEWAAEEAERKAAEELALPFLCKVGLMYKFRLSDF